MWDNMYGFVEHSLPYGNQWDLFLAKLNVHTPMVLSFCSWFCNFSRKYNITDCGLARCGFYFKWLNMEVIEMRTCDINLAKSVRFLIPHVSANIYNMLYILYTFCIYYIVYIKCIIYNNYYISYIIHIINFTLTMYNAYIV